MREERRRTRGHDVTVGGRGDKVAPQWRSSEEGKYSRFLTTRSPGAVVWLSAARPFSLLMWPEELAERSPLCEGSMASDIVA